ELARRGELDPEGMYTVGIFVAHGVVVRGGEEFLARFTDAVLEPIGELVKEGLVRWATLPEIARIWVEEYGEGPTIYIPADQRELIRSLFPEG
ncbi:MAG: hypothetical protein GXO72_01440, partial [Caldiserica bacterium]|nr:hypothetical protein [Caldisericota bacterium]